MRIQVEHADRSAVKQAVQIMADLGARWRSATEPGLHSSYGSPVATPLLRTGNAFAQFERQLLDVGGRPRPGLTSQERRELHRLAQLLEALLRA